MTKSFYITEIWHSFGRGKLPFHLAFVSANRGEDLPSTFPSPGGEECGEMEVEGRLHPMVFPITDRRLAEYVCPIVLTVYLTL